jgi:hypothetical protein
MGDPAPANSNDNLLTIFDPAVRRIVAVLKPTMVFKS